MSYSSQTVAVLKEELKNRGLSIAGVKADLINRLEDDDVSKKESAPVFNPEIATVGEKTQQEAPALEQLTSASLETQLQEEQPQPIESAAPAEQTDEEKAKIVQLIERWGKNIKDFETQIKRLERFGGDEAKVEKLKNSIAKTQEKITDVNTNGLRKKPTPAAPTSAPELSPEDLKKLAVEHLTKKLERASKFGSEDEKESISKELQRVEKFGVDAHTALAREVGLTQDRELGNDNRVHKRRNPKGYRNRPSN